MMASLTTAQEIGLQQLEEARGPALSYHAFEDGRADRVGDDEDAFEAVWASGQTVLDPDGTIVCDTYSIAPAPTT
jgi:hypothetical protein